MLKSLATYLLTLLVLLQSFSREVIVADFTIHRAQIAATLCEKRTVPKSCCAGSCYLRKQLKADAERQNAPAGSNAAADRLEMLPPAQTLLPQAPCWWPEADASFAPAVMAAAPTGNPADLLRPPRA